MELWLFADGRGVNDPNKKHEIARELPGSSRLNVKKIDRSRRTRRLEVAWADFLQNLVFKMKPGAFSQAKLNSILTLIALVVLAAILGACSARRTQLQSGSVQCQTPLSAVIKPVSGSLASVPVGGSVTWMVQAQGCSGKFRVEHDNKAYPFTSAIPAVFVATYPAAREMTEVVEISALDDQGQVIGQTTVSSTPFSIAGVSACTVIAGSDQISVPVNASNQMSEPVAISFQVKHTAPISIRQINIAGGTAVPAANINLVLPTVSALAHNLQLLVGAPGTQTFAFKVQNAAGELGECAGNVVLTPVVTQAPLITTFNASPMVLNIGQPMNLNLQATGNITSATIDGTPAPLNSGANTRSVIVTRTGALSSVATVTGPGGTSTRTAQYLVNPTCQIRPVQPPTALPGNLGLSIDIAGDFVVAVVNGPAISSGTIAGVTGGVTNFPLTVQMQTSPAVVTLTVYGPGNTSGTCGGTAIYTPPNLPPVPTLSLTADGQTGTVEVEALRSTTIAWSSNGATACTLKRDGAVLSSALSGSHVQTNITTDIIWDLNCSNAGGQATKIVTTKSVGRWFQVSNSNFATCASICNGMGLTNINSDEGARCASGENRPASAAGIISYSSCWPNCTPGNVVNGATSNQGWCYRPGQTQDSDPSDRTAGCFCGQ